MEPVIKRLRAPIAPVEIFKNTVDFPHSFFLDSGMDRFKLGRCSFLGFSPFSVFKSKGSRIEIIENGKTTILYGNPFEEVKRWFYRYRTKNVRDFPPFQGGAVGYFSYDLNHFIEVLPETSIDDLDLPECYLCLYDVVIAYDHLKDEGWIISTGLPQGSKAKAEERIKEIEEIIYGEEPRIKLGEELNTNYDFKIHGFDYKDTDDIALTSNFSRDGYIEAIIKSKEYIAAGDIFQVNLSQRFYVEYEGNPYILYMVLRQINPAPFASFLNFDEVKIVSASPERFLRISKNLVQTRPIKGTRPRGKDSKKDKILSEELMSSKKDRAELVMIVDLERNDIGRVCEFGTVNVPELIILEKYATVFHLVSTVEGRLREDKDHIDCLAACFPGGSITGAPKVRAMEIIDELEPTKRSIYTGSIGYMGFNQETDLNIVIRTIIVKDKRAFFQAGGGIVADSDPELEYVETLDKAKALIQSLTYRHNDPNFAWVPRKAQRHKV